LARILGQLRSSEPILFEGNNLTSDELNKLIALQSANAGGIGLNPFYKEKDPNGLDLKTAGAKADENKAPVFQGVLQYFPRALREVARTSQIGARKYSWKGWESVPDGINRYADALGRHIISEAIEGEFDGDTGLLHASQVAWNALARLELILRKKENGNKK
jgi:Domain of unknown function (DUF5664)